LPEKHCPNWTGQRQDRLPAAADGPSRRAAMWLQSPSGRNRQDCVRGIKSSRSAVPRSRPRRNEPAPTRGCGPGGPLSSRCFGKVNPSRWPFRAGISPSSFVRNDAPSKRPAAAIGMDVSLRHGRPGGLRASPRTRTSYGNMRAREPRLHQWPPPKAATSHLFPMKQRACCYATVVMSRVGRRMSRERCGKRPTISEDLALPPRRTIWRGNFKQPWQPCRVSS